VINVGDDVITQTVGTTTTHLGYDGHGSTRTLTDEAGAIATSFHFDAYGKSIALGRDADVEYCTVNQPDCDLLYSGEQYDTPLQMQYLRARYYDQNVGGFNRLDDYAGSRTDPQSLHKYLYAHCDPVNGMDPSGNWTLTEIVVATAISMVIAGLVGGILGGIRNGLEGAIRGAYSGAKWALILTPIIMIAGAYLAGIFPILISELGGVLVLGTAMNAFGFGMNLADLGLTPMNDREKAATIVGMIMG